MATKKKKTPVKKINKPISPKLKKSKKKSKKKSSLKNIGFSTLIIIIIVILLFFYLNGNKKGDIIEQIDQQTSEQVEHKPLDQVVAESTQKLDGYSLQYYYPTANLKDGGIVENLAYSLDYNEDHEQADWVIYELTKEEVLTKEVPRKDNFIPDPSASITSAHPSDYYKSGYDWGYLCPAADNRWSAQAMEESFYMSNMSPQHPDLNRKIWAELEKKVRDWAVENEKVYVVTGPILADGFKHKIGKNEVSVPNYYYKVVADLTGDEIKGVGFIFSNGENNGELKNFAFSIKTVEERTKIDFFHKLDKKIQAQIENDFDVKEWFK